MPVVYIDVLFAVNLVLNYLILWATAGVAGLTVKGGRIFVGALIGAVYAVCVFFPQFDGLYLMISKIAMSVILVAIAFGIKKGFKEFAKTIGLFYLVCFVFGGVVAGLFFFSGTGGLANAVMSGGTLYIDLPWTVLGISAGGAFLLLTLAVKRIKGGILRNGLKSRLTVVCDGKTAVFDAFLDTGNSLKEPVSGSPVIVAEMASMLELLPDEMIKNIQNGGVQELLSIISDERWLTRLRLIPFSVIGLEHGMLAGFRPDYAILDHNKGSKTVGDCIVAVYAGTLSGKNGCSAILNPEVMV